MKTRLVREAIQKGATVDEARFGRFEIVDTVSGKFMVLCNGFQIGGAVDASGAGCLEFDTRLDAQAFITNQGVLK